MPIITKAVDLKSSQFMFLSNEILKFYLKHTGLYAVKIK